MLKTIDRYVIREVVPPFLLALLIFTFILELPPVMDELERLVAKGVPWQTVGRIILLLMPQALGLTIPMALLVGLLIGLGRMSTDREAVALLACGVSPYRLLRPVMAARHRRHRRDDVRDDRGDSGLQPALPADPVRNPHQEGRERNQAARVLPGVPELALYPARRGRPGAVRLEGPAGREYEQARGARS